MRNLFLFLLISSCSFEQDIKEADLVITSNKVILMTGNMQAQPLSIAIKNKEIVWIGSHKKAKRIQGKHIDFGNQAILPGFIETELIADLPEEQVKEYKASVPLKRFGQTFLLYQH